MGSDNNIQSSSRLPGWSAPAYVLLITTAGIFLAELVAMVVIYYLPALTYAVQTLLDAVIMTTLIFPLLYFLSFRELLNHIQRHQQNERQLPAGRLLRRNQL